MTNIKPAEGDVRRRARRSRACRDRRGRARSARGGSRATTYSTPEGRPIPRMARPADEQAPDVREQQEPHQEPDGVQRAPPGARAAAEGDALLAEARRRSPARGGSRPWSPRRGSGRGSARASASMPREVDAGARAHQLRGLLERLAARARSASGAICHVDRDRRRGAERAASGARGRGGAGRRSPSRRRLRDAPRGA